jgi:hypothetical protein
MWSQPPRWNAAARKTGVVATVFCASLADVFEYWPGRCWHHTGKPLVRANGRWEPEATEQHESCSGVTLADVRRRLFAMIDDTISDSCEEAIDD